MQHGVQRPPHASHDALLVGHNNSKLHSNNCNACIKAAPHRLPLPARQTADHPPPHAVPHLLRPANQSGSPAGSADNGAVMAWQPRACQCAPMAWLACGGMVWHGAQRITTQPQAAYQALLQRGHIHRHPVDHYQAVFAGRHATAAGSSSRCRRLCRRDRQAGMLQVAVAVEKLVGRHSLACMACSPPANPCP